MTISAATGTWTIGANWPWPRMFVTDYYVLAVAVKGTYLAVYELVNDSDTWTATEIGVLGLLTKIDQVDIAYSGPYYIVTASGHDSAGILWTNMVERSVTGFATIDSSEIPHGTTICNYKNQLLIGGLKTADSKWANLGQCAVAYGGIGNKVFDPETDPSAGFLKMPWDNNGQGKVYKILRLKDHIVVYGDRGIEKLTPFAQDKITGFGQETLWESGILGSGCVGGSVKVSCFIDENYDLCLLTDEVKVLGYRRFMETLTIADVIISYEPKQRYFYISDGVLCYVLTPSGLYSTNQCPSSIGSYNNIVCGFFLDNSDNEIRLETTEFDLNSQGLKTLESVEFGVSYTTGADESVSSRVSGRYTYKDSFTNLAWTVLNSLGVLTQRLTARSFKIGLKADYDSAGTFKLGALRGSFQFPDNRNIRGKL